MSSFHIRTWTRSLSDDKLAQAEQKLKALDPDFALLTQNTPGWSNVRMWLERPNDGRNNEHDQRELNRQAVAIVEALLDPAEELPGSREGWARFAAAALQGLLAAPESNTDQSETNIARLAGAYADALSREYVKRCASGELK